MDGCVKVHWSFAEDPIQISFFLAGTTDEDFVELGNPECPFIFAGEHTSTEEYASVHGAYESGLRAAGAYTYESQKKEDYPNGVSNERPFSPSSRCTRDDTREATREK